MLKTIILGFLNYRPMTGYDIKRLMGVSTEHFWDAKLSQIYTTLKKLEADDSVQSQIEAQEDRPNRRIYTITDKGRTELNSWLGTVITTRENKKDPLLLKMFFTTPENKKTLITQLRLQLDLHQEQLRLYHEESPTVIEDFVTDQPELVPNIMLWDLTRRFGVMYEETYIQWLKEAIQTLEEI